MIINLNILNNCLCVYVTRFTNNNYYIHLKQYCIIYKLKSESKSPPPIPESGGLIESVGAAAE